MKRFQLWMAFLLLILFSILLAASYFAREIFVPVSLKKNKVLVVVPTGSSCAQIADELSHKGLIRSAFSFRLLSRFTGAQSKMKAGTYRFSPSYNEVEILRRLVLGKSILIKVTIPEGFDLRQIEWK